MKVAAPYAANKKWKDIPDEYNINYTAASTIQKLKDFCESCGDKRVNVRFKDTSIPVEKIAELSKSYDKLYVRLTSEQSAFLMSLKNNNIKFFFDYTFPCYSGAVLDFLINIGSTDVYLYDSLWYNLPQVADRCKKEGVQIRLVLNHIPSLRPDAGKDYCAPLFSPKDMDYIEQFVDVGEFDCTIGEEEAYNWHTFEVYYKNWFIKRDWIGTLDELNSDVDMFIPVASMPLNFIKRRCECNRKCSLGVPCNHCESYIKLAQKWDSEGIVVTKIEE